MKPTLTLLLFVTAGAARQLVAQTPGAAGSGASWAPEVVALLTSPVVSALLIMLGLGGIFYAIKTGHLGMLALAGLASIVLFFTVQYSADLATALEIVMFMAGVALVLAEVFLIPGVGVVGIFGAVMIVASLFLALVGDFTLLSYSSITVPLYTIAASFVGVIVIMALMLRYLPTSSSFTRFVLQDNVTPMEALLPGSYSALVDVVGEAVTTLRPAGVGLLRGVRHDVISDGDFIDAGEEIRVVRVEGRKIVVRRNVDSLENATEEPDLPRLA